MSRTFFVGAITLSLLAPACDEKKEPVIPPSTGTTATPATSPIAATAPVVTASAVAVLSASAVPSGSASAAPSASGSAALAANAAKDASAASSARAGDGKPVGMHVKGNNFAVDVSAPGNCKVQSPCAMSIKLTALGSYHINNEYPYKWVGDPIDGIEYIGKKNGEFKKETETQATMTVAFKSAGTNAKVGGVYKLSVCSEDKCQIETQRVELSVPMM